MNDDIQLPPQAFQTYSLRRPSGTDFWRAATCEEVECPYWRDGWETRVDLMTELGQAQAAYIRKNSGRSFSFEHEGDLGVFTFTPGQACFGAADHKVAREREPIAVVTSGSQWLRRHTRLADWRDDMQEHLGRVAEDRQRG